MEKINDHVKVTVSQHVLPSLAGGSKATLQYVVTNSGFDVVKFHVDFRKSTNITLYIPVENGSKELVQRAASEIFDVQVQPFERRVMVYVARKQKSINQRAFVRAEYTLLEAKAPDMNTIDANRARSEANLQDLLAKSIATYKHTCRWDVWRWMPLEQVNRICEDINVFAKKRRLAFVDWSFPPCLSSLSGSNNIDTVSVPDDKTRERKDEDSMPALAYTLCGWLHLRNVVGLSWVFACMQTRGNETKEKLTGTEGLDFTCGLPSQDSFLCAMAILSSMKMRWIKQWWRESSHLMMSKEMEIEDLYILPVMLCEQGLQWKQVVIDMYFPAFPIGKGLMTPYNNEGELYAMVLHKAVTLGRFSDVNDAQNQETRTSLKRRLLESMSTPNASAVVSFAKLDDHHRAFTLLSVKDTESDQQQRGIKLRDVNDALNKSGICRRNTSNVSEDRSALEDNTDMVQLTWEELFAFEPHIWIQFHDHCYELRRRVTRLNRRKRGTISTTDDATRFVLSASALSNLVITGSCITTDSNSKTNERIRIGISLEIVDQNFSLSNFPLDNTRVSDSSASNQVIGMVGAGEYILTVWKHSNDDAECEFTKNEDIMTRETTETNLRLLFECLDQDMDNVLSTRELQQFVQLYEPSYRSTSSEMIKKWLQRFGSVGEVNGMGSEGLTVDDLREVYHYLHETNVENATVSIQELIWTDLCLLLSNDSLEDLCEGNEPDTVPTTELTEISSRGIDQLICCIHSDVPLLNFVAFPQGAYSSLKKQPSETS